MDAKITNVRSEDLTQLKRDIELIKDILISEGELTHWAKGELEKARNTPRKKYVNHEEVKNIILMK